MQNFKNKELHDLLAKRSLNIDKVADMIYSGRSHVVQVLRGQRTGKVTWGKLALVLTEEEYKTAKAFADKQLEANPARAAKQSAFSKDKKDDKAKPQLVGA